MKKPPPIVMATDLGGVSPQNAIVARDRRLARHRSRESAARLDCGYPPGYFSELVVKHDWPPEFRPSTAVVDRISGSAASARSSATREAAAARGEAWGIGRILLPGTPLQAKPSWDKSNAKRNS